MSSVQRGSVRGDRRDSWANRGQESPRRGHRKSEPKEGISSLLRQVLYVPRTSADVQQLWAGHRHYGSLAKVVRLRFGTIKVACGALENCKSSYISVVCVEPKRSAAVRQQWAVQRH